MREDQSCGILLVRTDFLGDSILSSTLIKALSALDVPLDILCYDYNHVVFAHNPHLKHKYCLHATPHTDKEIIHNQQTLRAVAKNNYLATFVLNRSLKNYRLIRQLKTQFIFGHRLGIKSLRAKLFCLLSRALSKKYHYVTYNDSIHEVENQFKLLNLGLGILKCVQPAIHPSLANISLPVVPDPNCYFYTANYNPEMVNQGRRNTTTVVVNISGRQDTVRYLPTTLARCIIVDILTSDKQVLIVAAPDDAKRAQELRTELCQSLHKMQYQQQFMGGNQMVDIPITLCVEANLLKLADVMAQYTYYIGADGGLLHVAAGLQMHCIGLFHAQNIESWKPWSKKQICLQTASKNIYDINSPEVLEAIVILDTVS